MHNIDVDGARNITQRELVQTSTVMHNIDVDGARTITQRELVQTSTDMHNIDVDGARNITQSRTGSDLNCHAQHRCRWCT